MQAANWKELPAELLLSIANCMGGASSAMRGVCRDWRTGLEAISTQLTIIKSAVPPSLPARFQSLTMLDLRGCGHVIAPRHVRALQGLPLHQMAIKAAPANITVTLANNLRALGLARLDLELAGDRELFLNAHLRRLAGLPIAQLDLSETSISRGGLSALHDLPQLNSLDLSYTFSPGRGMVEADLAELRGLSLSSISLRGRSDIRDEVLVALRDMPLVSVNLSGCIQITDEGLEVFHGKPLTRSNTSGISMEGLWFLRGRPITDLRLGSGAIDEVVGLLSGMPLTRLDARHCGFTDAGAECLRGMPLQDLRLYLGEMTDVGLAVFRGAPLTQG